DYVLRRAAGQSVQQRVHGDRSEPHQPADCKIAPLADALTPTKARGEPGFAFNLRPRSLHGCLGDTGLERPVGLLSKTGIKLAELGRPDDELLVGRLDIVALHLDRLIERLRAEQLLGRHGAVLEHLLTVVRHFNRDGLETLRQGPQRCHCGIHVILPELLHILEILDHGGRAFPARLAACCCPDSWAMHDPPAASRPAKRHILHCTKMSSVFVRRNMWRPIDLTWARSRQRPAQHGPSDPGGRDASPYRYHRALRPGPALVGGMTLNALARDLA